MYFVTVEGIKHVTVQSFVTTRSSRREIKRQFTEGSTVEIKRDSFQVRRLVRSGDEEPFILDSDRTYAPALVISSVSREICYQYYLRQHLQTA